MKSFPSTERGTWHMIHTRTSLVVTGERLPHLHKSPLHIGGRTHEPGARFCYMGGKKTSAGFEHLDFRDAEPMTYVGQMLDQHIADMALPPSRPIGLPLACFTQGDKPGPGAFYAWHYDEKEGSFIWGTDAHAGRVIEHDQTALEGEPGPPREAEPTNIRDTLAAYKLDGKDRDTAVTLLKMKFATIRESRRSLGRLFDSLPEPKPQAFDCAEHPTWWRCLACWTEFSIEATLPPPCPACQMDTEALARWWRADERKLLLALDAAIGIHSHPYPAPPL